MKAELRPYQEEGCAWIDFLYRHRFGACLADDMGLGKTVQTIGFLAQFFEQNPDHKKAPVLIVLPPSLVFNWQEEFARFAPSLKVTECLRKGAWHKAPDDSQILLTTYDRIRLDLSPIQGNRFEIVVFDEGHNLKNVSAARTKAAAQIARRFTLCLTGTPVENNASEFYSVMSAAVPGIFGTLKAFKEYFREAPDRILGRSRPFILRRTKDKILKDLPKKEEHELFLEMSPMQKEIYTRTTEVKLLRPTKIAPNNKPASLRSLRFYAYARYALAPVIGQKTARARAQIRLHGGQARGTSGRRSWRAHLQSIHWWS